MQDKGIPEINHENKRRIKAIELAISAQEWRQYDVEVMGWFHKLKMCSPPGSTEVTEAPKLARSYIAGLVHTKSALEPSSD